MAFLNIVFQWKNMHVTSIFKCEFVNSAEVKKGFNILYYDKHWEKYLMWINELSGGSLALFRPVRERERKCSSQSTIYKNVNRQLKEQTC